MGLHTAALLKAAGFVLSLHDERGAQQWKKIPVQREEENYLFPAGKKKIMGGFLNVSHCLREKQSEIHVGIVVIQGSAHPCHENSNIPITPSARGKDNIFFCWFHLKKKPKQNKQKDQNKAVSWKKASFHRRHLPEFHAKIIKQATVRRYYIEKVEIKKKEKKAVAGREIKNSSHKCTTVISAGTGHKQKGTQEKKRPKNTPSFYNNFSLFCLDVS